MKNTRFYPFERNRFFYGKLLTVRDFDSEQKYFNDKRRLINRLLHGSGVVCGLQVVAVDEKTISVEAGVAIDYAGREIVVATPVTQKLSMFDGFTNNEYAKDVYLYLYYEELGKEPVHSVASSATRPEEVSEYNRTMENYRLYVAEEPPDPTRHGVSSLKESRVLIYQDGKLRIWQTTPRFVNPGGTFEMKLQIEKVLQTPHLELKYRVVGENCIMSSGDSEGTVSFSEPQASQNTEYELKYLFKVRENLEATERVSLKTDSVQLRVGDREIRLDIPEPNQMLVVTGLLSEKVLNQYLDLTLEQRIGFNPDQGICLAKISLLKIGPTFLIEKVEPVPMGEYVYNVSDLYNLGLMGGGGAEEGFRVKAKAVTLSAGDQPQLLVNYDEGNREFDFQLGIPEPRATSNITSGVADIGIESKSRTGVSYFSDEIDHGLGTGPVLIVTATEVTASDESVNLEEINDRLFFGDASVFAKSGYDSPSAQVLVGTVLYPNRGSFRVGIKLLHNKIEKVRVHWWAYKEKAEK
ncbi:MAG: hypothetical protein HPY50_07270 [Firmicutes bacterium]|nr:hypothetical protein [Bacillota bacterium]